MKVGDKIKFDFAGKDDPTQIPYAIFFVLGINRGVDDFEDRLVEMFDLTVVPGRFGAVVTRRVAHR